MVRHSFCLALVTFCSMAGFASITNLQDVININLTSNNLERLPVRDLTTPDTAFLGFTRGLLQGNFTNYLYCLTPELQLEAIGTTNLALVTTQQCESFALDSLELQYTNHVLTVAQLTNINSKVMIYAQMISARVGRVDNEAMKVFFSPTNGIWKISSWDVEKK